VSSATHQGMWWPVGASLTRPSPDELVGASVGAPSRARTAIGGSLTNDLRISRTGVRGTGYGRAMALTKVEREQFLAEPHVAALSVESQDGRAPLTVPIWYQYSPGAQLWVLTGARSHKIRLIESAGRFTMMVDRVRPSVRYVSVEGPVSGIEPGTEEHLHEIAHRYLPERAAARYIEFARAELGEQVVVSLRPERWLTADLG